MGGNEADLVQRALSILCGAPATHCAMVITVGQGQKTECRHLVMLSQTFSKMRIEFDHATNFLGTKQSIVSNCYVLAQWNSVEFRHGYEKFCSSVIEFRYYGL